MELLVNIDVDDLPTAIAFYQRAFGLRVGRRFGAFGAEMLGATAPIYLLVKAGGTAATHTSRELRDYQRHWTPVHLDFVVRNLDHSVSRALDAGASRDGPMQTHVWGRIAHMADPFGHGFCLIEFLNRGYDEIVEASSVG